MAYRFNVFKCKPSQTFRKAAIFINLWCKFNVLKFVTDKFS